MSTRSHESEPVPEVVSEGIETLMNDVPAMATACQAAGGSKLCFLCGAVASVLVIPGWGGVWLCRPCDVENPPP